MLSDLEPGTMVTVINRNGFYKVLYYRDWIEIGEHTVSHVAVVEPVNENGVPLHNIVRKVCVQACSINVV